MSELRAVDRDATISALKSLSRRIQREDVSKHQLAGYRRALAALLERTQPDLGNLDGQSKSEMALAIDEAVAYLEHAPVQATEEAHQQTFDGFFVSLITKSWWVRGALALLVVAIFGGDLLLGYKTAGVLADIEATRNSSLSGIAQKELELTEDISAARARIDAAASSTSERISALAAKTETDLSRQVLEASNDVVTQLGKDAQVRIDAQAGQILNELRQEHLPRAVRRITDTSEDAVRDIGRAGDVEMDEISGRAKPIIAQLEVDITQFGTELETAEDRLEVLSERLAPLEQSVENVGSTVARLIKPGSGLETVAATLGVSGLVLGAVSFLAALSIVASIVAISGLRGSGKRIAAIVVGFLALVAVGTTAWQVSKTLSTELAPVAIDEPPPS